MTEIYILDTGPLGILTHPKPNQEFVVWFQQLLQRNDVVVYVPEISDYELRRNLLLKNFQESLNRLDQLEQTLEYLPITTEAMRRASELWAEMRKKGKPFASNEALDGDVILAAQAQQVAATVITGNLGHLQQITKAISGP